MPDSLESRFARLEARVDMLVEHGREYDRKFEDWSLIKDGIKRLHQDLGAIATTVRELDDRMGAAEEARDQRERQERKDRVARWLTLAMLVLTFVSTTTAVVAVVVQ